jgi:hypothetical protein
MSREDVFEQFTVSGATLSYRRGRESWEITPDRIACVGEATTESSRGEDWLLCLITDQHGAWLEASLYAPGRNDALQWLSTAVGTSLEVKLANAPAYRSRVMWPPPLREQPLFEFQISPLRRAFSRALRRLGFAPSGAVQTVNRTVLEHLWAADRPPASRSA